MPSPVADAESPDMFAGDAGTAPPAIARAPADAGARTAPGTKPPRPVRVASRALRAAIDAETESESESDEPTDNKPVTLVPETPPSPGGGGGGGVPETPPEVLQQQRHSSSDAEHKAPADVAENKEDKKGKGKKRKRLPDTDTDTDTDDDDDDAVLALMSPSPSKRPKPDDDDTVKPDSPSSSQGSMSPEDELFAKGTMAIEEWQEKQSKFDDEKLELEIARGNHNVCEMEVKRLKREWSDAVGRAGDLALDKTSTEVERLKARIAVDEAYDKYLEGVAAAKRAEPSIDDQVKYDTMAICPGCNAVSEYFCSLDEMYEAGHPEAQPRTGPDRRESRFWYVKHRAAVISAPDLIKHAGSTCTMPGSCPFAAPAPAAAGDDNCVRVPMPPPEPEPEEAAALAHMNKMNAAADAAGIPRPGYKFVAKK